MGQAIHEVDEDVDVLRLRGGFELADAVAVCRETMRRMHARGRSALLLDATEIGGFGSPGIADRHWLMTELAEVGRGRVCVAFVIRPEFIDPDHFGTNVARSRGFRVRGFTDAARALAWLREVSE